MLGNSAVVEYPEVHKVPKYHKDHVSRCNGQTNIRRGSTKTPTTQAKIKIVRNNKFSKIIFSSQTRKII